jgi:hypothetical protein
MSITKAQQGKILIAIASHAGMLAWVVDEPVYRVALLVLFAVVWFTGWVCE